jgi:hypothetical protein
VLRGGPSLCEPETPDAGLQLPVLQHLTQDLEASIGCRLAAGCEWVRVRGNAEYVTVTVGGTVADERIALFEAAAACADPGDWTIVATAVPPLS